MNNLPRNLILLHILISIFVLSCQSDQDKSGLTEKDASVTKGSEPDPEEDQIIATVEKILFAVGTYNLEDLVSMISDKAMLGISSYKNGAWSNSEITIDEYIENVKKRKLTPYYAKVNDYEIMLSEGRFALVRADAIIHQFGIPAYREINNFTLMKENENWKFLNISFTVKRIEEKNRKYDADVFANSYAQAWSSRRPEFVSFYFANDGSLQVNDGDPAIGNDAISKVAQGIMKDLPDMILRFDSLVSKSNGTEFHWTLRATNSGPGGTGKKIDVNGYELWQLDSNGLIKNSRGNFPIKGSN